MHSTFFSNLCLHVLARVIRVAWLGNVTGLKRLPDRPCIIIANHASYLDFLLIGYLFERVFKKDLTFWAKSRVTQHPIWSPLAKRFKTIEIKTAPNFTELLEQTKNCLRSGAYVCVFPEGHRSVNGELNDFKAGYLHAAYRLQVPIVPVILNETHNAWPPGKLYPICTRCDISVGEPFTISSPLDSDNVSNINGQFMQRFKIELQHKPENNHVVS